MESASHLRQDVHTMLAQSEHEISMTEQSISQKQELLKSFMRTSTPNVPRQPCRVRETQPDPASLTRGLNLLADAAGCSQMHNQQCTTAQPPQMQLSTTVGMQPLQMQLVYAYTSPAMHMRQPAHTQEHQMNPRFGEAQLSHTPNESLLQQLLLTARQGKLPRLEPEVFDGDLLKFPSWWTLFEALIESKADLPSELLFYLGEYTTGDAKASIQGYLTLCTHEAYSQAKAVLQSRFGNKV